MIRRAAPQQLSFNSGELSPAASKRVEIKQYYAAAKTMSGWEPIPQGGARTMPGTTLVGRVRKPLTLAGAVGPLSVTSAAPLTLATLDLGSVQPISVIEWSLTSGASAGTDTIVVETQNPSTLAWEAFGLPCSHGQTRTRRLTLSDRGARSARYVRLRLTPTIASQTWSGIALSAFIESATPAVARGMSFLSGAGFEYDGLMTAGNLDLMLGTSTVGCAALNATALTIPFEKFVQTFNTAIFCHQDHAPWRVQRARPDASHEWTAGLAPFTNVPLVDLNGVYTSIAERHSLYLTFTSGGAVGLTATVTVNGETCASVEVAAGPAWSTFATALATAINALPGVGASGVVGSVVGTPTATAAQIQLEFSGANTVGNSYTVGGTVVAMTGTNTGAINAARTRKGVAGGEPIMSASAGWPETITFFQERFILAGFRSRASAILSSQAGEYYQLDTNIESATGPILVDVGNIGGETISALPRGRHLNVHTTRSDYYIRNQQLSRSAPLDVAISNANGTARYVQPVENEGAIVYASANGALIYEGRYSDVSQIYEQVPLSLLADHLITGVRAMAIQRASLATDAARLWMVMNDGSVVVGVLIRGQEVTAFVRYPVAGFAKDVWTNGRNEVNFLIERSVGAGVDLFHERVDEAAWLLGTVTGVVAGDGVTVTGLSAHEGQSVWAIADGWPVGPFTVASGAITLQRAAVSVTVGRWIAPVLSPLPLSRQVSETRSLNRPARVHGVWLDLVDTTAISVGANGQAPREQALFRAGSSPVDQPPQPVTRELDIDGLAGYSDQTDVVVTLPRPGKATVRAMQIHAKI
jgi:hypothetical protein